MKTDDRNGQEPFPQSELSRELEMIPGTICWH
jgi:hypothetical protein